MYHKWLYHLGDNIFIFIIHEYVYNSDNFAPNPQYRVSGVGVSALTAVHGTRFEYGNIADTICEWDANLTTRTLIAH